MNVPIIVAELSANIAGNGTGGGLQHALHTVEAAAAAGADAIKLQTWTPGAMTLDTNYRIKTGAWAGRKLAELYVDAWTPWEWHAPIFARAKALGIEAWSTPFDLDALRFLEALGCPRFKVASFEILDIPLLKRLGASGRPIIISTGMATLPEIVDAIEAVRSGRWQQFYAADITLLKCTSAYPADPSEANLRTMVDMKYQPLENLPYHRRQTEPRISVGLSDHTMGSAVAVAATAMGATMIEKHFTLDRSKGGPDAHFSMEPAEFKQMVDDCRAAQSAIGVISYGPTAGESTELRRGIYWAKDLPANHIVDPADMVTARPSTEVTPRQAMQMIGSKLAFAVQRGDPVTWTHLEGL